MPADFTTLAADSLHESSTAETAQWGNAMTEFPRAASGPIRAIFVLGAYAVFVALVSWLMLPNLLSRWDAECLAGATHAVCSVLRTRQVPVPSVQAASEVGRFPFTSLRKIELQDLDSLQCRDLGIMRNEIFARHGHIFYKPEWRDYFAAQSWYKPSVSDALPLLSALEKENVGRIKEREATLFC